MTFVEARPLILEAAGRLAAPRRAIRIVQPTASGRRWQEAAWSPNAGSEPSVAAYHPIPGEAKLSGRFGAGAIFDCKGKESEQQR